MLKSQQIIYQDGHIQLNGYYTYDDAITKPRPVILVAHDWSGCNGFAKEKAAKLAELGYIGFALDMFGNGKVGNTKEEKSSLIQPFIHDRTNLQKRIHAALTSAKNIEQADSSQMGAIGFCFGGMCVLDLARSGADVKGVVSFHGLLQAPDNIAHPSINAKVLALHGYDDPMVTPDHVFAFANEMTEAKADWQLHMYGHTMHAFTNPQANDPDFGTLYDKTAAIRSWVAMKDFFASIFADDI